MQVILLNLNDSGLSFYDRPQVLIVREEEKNLSIFILCIVLQTVCVPLCFYPKLKEYYTNTGGFPYRKFL